MLKRREQRWGKIDGASPPQSQLDFIKQTGVSEVGGEFQLWRVSPRIRHYQSPLSLHEPGQALVLLKLARPGSSAPTGPNTLILILSERRIERGRHSTHISCTSCKPHMLHVTSLWFNGLQKEMKRETKRAAAVICLVYVNRLELGSYYSSPTSHTRELKPSGAIKGLNGVMRTHKHKPWFPECLLNSLCRTWGHTYGKWEVKKKPTPETDEGGHTGCKWYTNGKIQLNVDNQQIKMTP